MIPDGPPGLLAALLEAAPDGLLLVDDGGRIAFANARVEALFGHSRASLVGQPLELLVPEESREKHAREVDGFTREPRTRPMGNGVFPGRRHDGTRFPAEISLSTFELAGRRWVTAAVRDASERLRVESALRAEEQHARALFDEAPIGTAVTGLDGIFRRVNGSFAAMLGYAPDELVGRTFRAITHPDDETKDASHTEDVLAGRRHSFELEKRYVRRDGAVIDVVLHVSLLRDGAGLPSHFITQVQDVSELRRSEMRLRAFFEQAPDGVAVTDPDGRYEEVNEALCRMLGYTREEFLSLRVEDLATPEDLARLHAWHGVRRGSTDIARTEWRLLHRDGRRIPVEVSSRRLPDGRWQAFVRDVSERLRTEAALQASEAALTRALQVCGLGNWELDLLTGQMTRSAQYYALWGLPVPDTEPEPLAHVPYLHPADERRFLEAFQAAREQGRPFDLETRIVRADGEERVLRQQCEVTIVDGRPVRLTGTALDVTERVHANLALAKANAWLEAVFQQSPVGLRLREANGSARSNRRYAELMGGFDADFGDGPVDLLHVDGTPVDYNDQPLLRAMRGEVVDRQEYVIRHEDGRRTPVLQSARRILLHGQETLGAVAMTVDITPLKELERLRAEWTSIVAHDLRQPISTLHVVASLLEAERARVSPAGDRALVQLKGLASRLARMVNDLLDSSRLEARQLSLVRRRVDLAALVRDAVERLRLEHPDAPFLLDLAATPCELEADPDRLLQVLENLASNAVKYGRAGTAVTVTLAREADAFVLAVTNEGPGIPASERTQLFQRFHRTPDASGGGVRGTGLGLYIAHGLVQAHGGRLTVESVPGERTTFLVRLPAAAAPPQTEDAYTRSFGA